VRESVGVPFVEAGRIFVKFWEFSRSEKSRIDAKAADWRANVGKMRGHGSAARFPAEIRILKWPFAAGKVNVSGPGTY